MKRYPNKYSRRISFIRVAALVALGPSLAWAPIAAAQHAGGSRSGSSSGARAGGFAAGHSGGFSGAGPHGGFSAPHSLNGFSGPAQRGFGGRMPWMPRYEFAPQRRTDAGLRGRYGSADRGTWNHSYHHRPRYRGHGFGHAYPYAYANSWQLLPWDLGYPDFTDFWGAYGPSGDGASDQNYAQAPPPGAVQSLSPGSEREQAPPENDGYRPTYAPASDQPPAHQVISAPPPQNEPRLTLIFKDGHTLEIRNYMLTSRDLIVMDEAASGRESRIPLSELNLPATQQAARQAGLDFSPPSSNPS